MNFKSIHVLSIIFILSSIAIKAMEQPAEKTIDKKEALPLIYQTLIKSLQLDKITPEIAQIINTNEELKRAYDALKNLAEFGLKPEEIKSLYALIAKLDYTSLKLVINLINAVRDKIELSSNFKKIFDEALRALGSTDISDVNIKIKNRIIGNLLKELTNLIFGYVYFKGKIPLEVFQKKYKFSDVLLLEDTSNQLREPFMQLVRKLQIGDWHT